MISISASTDAGAEHAGAAKRSRKQYTQEQKRWIVRRRLELQPKFDNKLHKNDQVWDDIVEEYRKKFTEDAGRDKTSMWDAVWDKENSIFREWCKISHSFRIGLVSRMHFRPMVSVQM